VSLFIRSPSFLSSLFFSSDVTQTSCAGCATPLPLEALYQFAQVADRSYTKGGWFKSSQVVHEDSPFRSYQWKLTHSLLKKENNVFSCPKFVVSLLALICCLLVRHLNHFITLIRKGCPGFGHADIKSNSDEKQSQITKANFECPVCLGCFTVCSLSFVAFFFSILFLTVFGCSVCSGCCCAY
jgi:hypothetical protein